MQTDLAAAYEEAVRVLDRFNVVVIMEFMDTPRYQNALRTFLNTTEIPGHHQPEGFAERGDSEKQVDFDPSHMYDVEPEVVEKLLSLNEYDMKLYHRFAYAHTYQIDVPS